MLRRLTALAALLLLLSCDDERVESAAASREGARLGATPAKLPAIPVKISAAPAKLSAVPAKLAAKVELVRVARGLDRPVALEAAPGDRTGRLFVVEQGGRVRILRDGKVAATPFLDVSTLVSRDHEERGLLGLAFHPGYARNRRFFINYTDRKGATRVVEYRASAATPDRADPTSAKLVFSLAQPYANHNGGGLELGPDGKLYVGTGDGGAGGDPKGAGQDPDNLLGKMLRFDVDAAGQPRPEIVAVRLRNPWRYDFDDDTGDLYLADVGQDRWEEVDVVPMAKLGDANFGWSIMEGKHCFGQRRCERAGLIEPIVEYDHDTGCSVTGGLVYRGKAFPELRGSYFYADYCTAILRSVRWTAKAGATDHWNWKPVLDSRHRLANISAFGADADGELYVISLGGSIYKLARRGDAT